MFQSNFGFDTQTLHFQWDDDEVRFVLDQHAELELYSPRVDLSLHSGTLFWFRANQSMLFLLNAGP